MQREAAKYLYDAQDACERLSRFTAQKTLEDYARDEMLHAAVERQFEIIGEALNRALRLHPQLDQQITDLSNIIGLRNRMIHGYDTIDDRIVWDIIQWRVPVLLAELRRILRTCPAQ